MARTRRRGKRRWWAPLRERFIDFLSAGKLPRPLGYRSAELEIPGSPVTPFQARIVDYQGQLMFIAPAFHLMFDMSQRGGWYNMPGGASEHKLGPGYATGIDEWLQGGMRPLGREGDPLSAS